MLRFATVILCVVVSLLNGAFPVMGQSGPYPVNWVNQTGVTTNGSIITKTNPKANWDNAGATSSNLLASDTDGWMEFSVTGTSHFIVGFASNNIINATEFSNALYVDYTLGTVSAYEGSTVTGLGSFQSGDIFKIWRIGSLVKYYKNGSELRSVAATSSLVLKVKATIKLVGWSTPAIDTSFDAQLILSETITGTDGNSGSGSISLVVSGGTPPYTYSWSSGEQVNSIDNKPHGSYEATVTDALGRIQTRTYRIGYRLNWINQIGVSTSGTILTKNIPVANWNNAGGISSGILAENTDGWLQFSATSFSDFVAGFAVNNIINSTEFSYGIFLDYNTSNGYAYEGATLIGLGNFQAGDVFRISRETSTINYYKNGAVVRSVSTNPGLPLKVKAALRYQHRTTPNIITSFDSGIILQESIVGMNGNSGSGSISVDAIGGTPPYNFQWSTGEQTSSIINKAQGTYLVTVTDAVGRIRDRAYQIGYNINWSNQIGVSTSGTILTKNTPVANWNNSGGVSASVLPANTDGWMEFSTVNGADFIVGLTTNNTINWNAFSYALYADYTTGNFSSYEGSSTVVLGKYQTGDVFRISREGSSIKYYRNGIVVRTIAANPALALKVKSTIKFQHKSTPNINMSFWLSDGIVRTYYTIATGLWTDPAVWSLSDGGPPSTVYPSEIDKVVIKGHGVTVSSLIKSADVAILPVNNSTWLKIIGTMGDLTVKGNITMTGTTGTGIGSVLEDVLEVRDGGRLEVKSP